MGWVSKALSWKKEQCDLKQMQRVTASKAANSGICPLAMSTWVAGRRRPQLLAWYRPQQMVLMKKKSIQKGEKEYFSKCKSHILTYGRPIKTHYVFLGKRACQFSRMKEGNLWRYSYSSSLQRQTFFIPLSHMTVAGSDHDADLSHQKHKQSSTSQGRSLVLAWPASLHRRYGFICPSPNSQH